jgi:methionine-R-sulfoxide reductase
MDRRTLLKLFGLTALTAYTGIGCDAAGQDDAKDSNMSKTVKVKIYNSKGELTGPFEMPKVVKTDSQWKAQLTDDQYNIARAKGTEPSFCGNLWDNHKKGVYTCICCKLPLFSSDNKFDSGTGWPSFFQPVADENVYKKLDRDGEREEILCSRCDCHLGHVFDDGPAPTHLRFCVNSASMAFTESDKLPSLAENVPATQPAK